MVFYVFINILDDETGCAVLSAAPWLIAAWGVGDKQEGCCSEDQFYFHHWCGQTLALGP